MSATRYRNGAAGLTIRHAVAESWLGWLIVGATEGGVCAVEFGGLLLRSFRHCTGAFPALI